MMDQLTLGESLKNRGMGLADAAESQTWKLMADKVIRHLAESGQEFTAEDVRELAGDPTRPNAFGARFNSAARKGIIRQVGFRKATRATLHRHPIAVWVGA